MNPQRLASEMFCRACGYCLDGCVSPQCPECGKPFNPDDPSTFARFTGSKSYWWPLFLSIAWVAAFFGALYFLWIAAWVELGHPPRGASGGVSSLALLRNLVQVLLLSVLIVAPASLLWAAVVEIVRIRRHGIRAGGTLILANLAVWLIAFLWVVALDPMDVFRWFID